MAEIGNPARRRGQHLSAAARKRLQAAFLAAFAKSGIILNACAKVGVDRSTVDWWNEHDEEFNFAYGAAKREADDVIRREIWRRGVEGIRRRKTISRRDENGKMKIDRIETVTEYSDTMLALLAKSRIPEFRHGEVVRIEFDDEGMREFIDILMRAGIDEDTMARIRAELARTAAISSSTATE